MPPKKGAADAISAVEIQAALGELLRVMVVEVHEQFLKGMNAAYWYTTTVSCSKKGHRMIAKGDLIIVFGATEVYLDSLSTGAQRESWKGLGMMHVDDCHMGTVNAFATLFGQD
ncbi:hypothetical protein C6P46_000874 [Rhodotorula mucilaginosa]|uniref:Uncharacterized protein n=1 Tax=Rhodotorula mucilaginosa TaxID=5537 RepID=A0A9P6VTR5_RHOMI|nr:hypothetical protein C6P46_000874 [Rhodotorula mucilaginosa]